MTACRALLGSTARHGASHKSQGFAKMDSFALQCNPPRHPISTYTHQIGAISMEDAQKDTSVWQEILSPESARQDSTIQTLDRVNASCAQKVNIVMELHQLTLPAFAMKDIYVVKARFLQDLKRVLNLTCTTLEAV